MTEDYFDKNEAMEDDYEYDDFSESAEIDEEAEEYEEFRDEYTEYAEEYSDDDAEYDYGDSLKDISHFDLSDDED